MSDSAPICERERYIQLIWLLFAFAVVCLLVNTGINGKPLINNGDYGRVLLERLDVPQFQDWGYCANLSYATTGAQPRSSMAILIFAFARLSSALSVACLDVRWVYALLCAVLLGGCEAMRRLKLFNLPFAISYLLALLVFSSVMFSLYQEAILFALAPWFVVSLHWMSERRVWLLYLCVGCLIAGAKTQLIFWVPFLVWFCYRAWRSEKISGLIFVLLALAFLGTSIFVNFAHRNVSVANNYNRVFNGFGWVAQGVDGWPARSFKERVDYFARNKSELQANSI